MCFTKVAGVQIQKISGHSILVLFSTLVRQPDHSHVAVVQGSQSRINCTITIILTLLYIEFM